jgi:hypothetical protein
MFGLTRKVQYNSFLEAFDNHIQDCDDKQLEYLEKRIKAERLNRTPFG